MADLSVNDLIKQLREKSKSGHKDSKKATTEIKKTGKKNFADKSDLLK